MSIDNYISIHTHSDFSCLDSICKIPDLVKKAKKFGMSALALTDHGNISGWIKFYQECQKENIKPLFGIEAYICEDINIITNIDKRVKELEKVAEYEEKNPLFAWADKEFGNDKFEEKTDLDDKYNKIFENFLQGIESKVEQVEKLKALKKKHKKSNHVILIAKNKIGYHNIIKLSSHAWLNGFYSKPRIDLEILEKYSEGIICSSACLGGQISFNIMNGDFEKAEYYVKEYKRIFGDNFYLEMQLHEMEEQTRVNKVLIEYSKKYNIPMIITQDVHYLDKEDVRLHEIVVLLNNHKSQTVSAEKSQEQKETNSDDYFYKTEDLYFKSFEEMKNTWQKDHSYIPEKLFENAMNNTLKIANIVESFSILNNEPLLPKFDTGNITAREMFVDLIRKGAKQKIAPKIFNNPELKKIYDARLKEELDIILDLKFEGYFLIVHDIMNWCRKNDILAECRGSVSASLISYCLNIGQLDPIQHKLIFSRFINKSRSSAKYKLNLPEIALEQK